MADIFPAHSSSPVELEAQIGAERRGVPFLVFRAGDVQRIIEIPAAAERLTIGRGEGCDLPLDHDEEVSRLHAELERVGRAWVIADNGLSRNGSFVNGERVSGRRRLRDGDSVRLGTTQILYRAPAGSVAGETRAAGDAPTVESVTPTERRILVALCRPFRDTSAFSTPATNQQIADEVSLSVDRVKAHLRKLFEQFGVEPLPHNQKRTRLVELAFQSGFVMTHDLEETPGT
jgi:predicted component of type VI protein secretion system